MSPAQVVDVRDFGVKGTEIASDGDDGARLQAAINSVTCEATPGYGYIFIPPGRYRIETPIHIYGCVGRGLHVYGASRATNASGGGEDTCLVWYGEPGGTVVHTKGLCNGSWLGVNINGNPFPEGNVGKAKTCFWYDYSGTPPGGNATGLLIEGCTFSQATGPDSACLRIGNAQGGNNAQVDNLVCHDVRFVGNENYKNDVAFVTEYGVKTESGANTKNWAFYNCYVNGVEDGFMMEPGSGTLALYWCNGANNGWYRVGSFVRPGHCQTVIVGGASEASAPFGTRMLRGTNTANIEVMLYQWHCRAPADDIVVDINGPFSAKGVDWYNDRTPTSECWIKNNVTVLPVQSDGTRKNYGSDDIRGCTFTNSKRYVPLLDCGTPPNKVGGGAYARGSRNRVQTFGNLGNATAGGRHELKLEDVNGEPLQSMQGGIQLYNDTLPQGWTEDTPGELRHKYQSYIVTKHAWNINAQAQKLTLGYIGSHPCGVAGVFWDVLEPFSWTPESGNNGDLRLCVGMQDRDGTFLVAGLLRDKSIRGMYSSGYEKGDLGDLLIGLKYAQGVFVPNLQPGGSNREIGLTFIAAQGETLGNGTLTKLATGKLRLRILTVPMG